MDKLSPEEKRYYGSLFKSADTESIGVITGAIAVKFFERSGLPAQTLGQIWEISDKDNSGFLTQQSFSVALRLIGQAQNGNAPDSALAKQPGPLPKFDGFDLPRAPPKRGVPALTPDDRTKYYGTWQGLHVNGLLEGERARDIFGKANLPNEQLAEIWTLADTQQRGALDSTEFIVAMHLIQSAMNGVKAMPQVLPPGLYEQAKGPRPVQSPVVWDVKAHEKANYDNLFNDIDRSGKGFITGEEAVGFFMQSKLPEDDLASVWDLSDMDNSGTLDKDAFAVSMHLIKLRLSGKPLPKSLPQTLVPPAARKSKPSADLFDLPMSPVQSPVQFVPASNFGQSIQPKVEQDLMSNEDVPRVNNDTTELANITNQMNSLNTQSAQVKQERSTLDADNARMKAQKESIVAKLAQIRQIYDSEVKVVRELQIEQGSLRAETKELSKEASLLEASLGAIKQQHDQIYQQLEADRAENQKIKERIKSANDQTATLKATLEKVQKDAKQQRGLVAINTKQLNTQEAEHERLNAEIEAEQKAHEADRITAIEQERKKAMLEQKMSAMHMERSVEPERLERVLSPSNPFRMTREIVPTSNFPSALQTKAEHIDTDHANEDMSSYGTAPTTATSSKPMASPEIEWSGEDAFTADPRVASPALDKPKPAALSRLAISTSDDSIGTSVAANAPASVGDRASTPIENPVTDTASNSIEPRDTTPNEPKDTTKIEPKDTTPAESSDDEYIEQPGQRIYQPPTEIDEFDDLEEAEEVEEESFLSEHENGFSTPRLAATLPEPIQASPARDFSEFAHYGSVIGEPRQLAPPIEATKSPPPAGPSRHGASLAPAPKLDRQLSAADDPMLLELMEMGFDRQKSVSALEKFNYDLGAATDYLLKGGE